MREHVTESLSGVSYFRKTRKFIGSMNSTYIFPSFCAWICVYFLYADDESYVVQGGVSSVSALYLQK